MRRLLLLREFISLIFSTVVPKAWAMIERLSPATTSYSRWGPITFGFDGAGWGAAGVWAFWICTILAVRSLTISPRIAAISRFRSAIWARSESISAWRPLEPSEPSIRRTREERSSKFDCSTSIWPSTRCISAYACCLRKASCPPCWAKAIPADNAAANTSVVFIFASFQNM